jgi:hypothetical protein
MVVVSPHLATGDLVAEGEADKSADVEANLAVDAHAIRKSSTSFHLGSML